MSEERQDVTALLLAWDRGDRQAGERLMAAVHRELGRIAARQLRGERPGHTLQPTALVNEAYLRLVDQKAVRWQGRAQFFHLAARMMRRILIDHARRRRYAKRGGGLRRVPLEEVEPFCGGRSGDLVDLDEALTALAAVDPRRAEIVELRYFGGLQVREIAEALGLSTATVNRDWRAARAWLYLRLRPDPEA